jgi:hypothetical protein
VVRDHRDGVKQKLTLYDEDGEQVLDQLIGQRPRLEQELTPVGSAGDHEGGPGHDGSGI